MNANQRPLAGKRIALAETRELDALAKMLEDEGAVPVRYPLVAILDAPDPAPIRAWLDRLLAEEFDDLVLYTGEGLRRLLSFSEREGLREPFVAAIGRVRTITRGPKPARALKEIGLAPARTAKAPTTDGLVATLAESAELGPTVAVQLFADRIPEPLERFLEERGVRVAPVSPYVYAPASDGERVAELITEAKTGKIDVVVFTSSPQVDRLFQVAKDRESHEELLSGLEAVTVAAVGPVVAENLRNRGVGIDVEPESSFFMKSLVKELIKANSV